MSKKKYELTIKSREAKKELNKEIDKLKKSKEVKALIIVGFGIIVLLTILNVFNSSSKKGKLSFKQEKKIQDIIEKALRDKGGQKEIKNKSWLKIPQKVLKIIPKTVSVMFLKSIITQMLKKSKR